MKSSEKEEKPRKYGSPRLLKQIADGTVERINKVEPKNNSSFVPVQTVQKQRKRTNKRKTKQDWVTFGATPKRMELLRVAMCQNNLTGAVNQAISDAMLKFNIPNC